MIFGFEARPPIGEVLGFLGYYHEIMVLMQTLSHSTRAFIVNAKGLSGFVYKFEVMRFLRISDKRGLLENAKKH